MTPLTAAAAMGNTEVARALVDLGAPIDQGGAGAGDVSALDRAVLGNQIKTAKLLIERGANVNYLDRFGMTPLLWAANVDFGDSAMIDLLLASGASKDARTPNGLTALGLAHKYNHKHLLPALTVSH
jgi:ankyrin repeat protein